MTEVSIREQLKKMVELQEIDIEIYNLKKVLTEKPIYIEELKVHFEGKKSRLHEMEERFKQMQVVRKTKEGDLQAKDEAIAKANAQLSQIKTNKEYTARITEIESIKADKSIIEEQLLISYDEADTFKTEIDKEKALLAEEEKKYQSEKKEVEDSIKEMQDRIKVLESQRKEIVPEVDKDVLSRYEKVLANKEGLAIVPVQGQSCGGCFMNVPAQVVNEIKKFNKVIACEMCARILYLAADL